MNKNELNKIEIINKKVNETINDGAKAGLNIDVSDIVKFSLTKESKLDIDPKKNPLMDDRCINVLQNIIEEAIEKIAKLPLTNIEICDYGFERIIYSSMLLFYFSAKDELKDYKAVEASFKHGMKNILNKENEDSPVIMSMGKIDIDELLKGFEKKEKEEQKSEKQKSEKQKSDELEYIINGLLKKILNE